MCLINWCLNRIFLPRWYLHMVTLRIVLCVHDVMETEGGGHLGRHSKECISLKILLCTQHLPVAHCLQLNCSLVLQVCPWWTWFLSISLPYSSSFWYLLIGIIPLQATLSWMQFAQVIYPCDAQKPGLFLDLKSLTHFYCCSLNSICCCCLMNFLLE